jgi:hypothetical protein
MDTPSCSGIAQAVLRAAQPSAQVKGQPLLDHWGPNHIWPRNFFAAKCKLIDKVAKDSYVSPSLVLPIGRVMIDRADRAASPSIQKPGRASVRLVL